MKKKMIVLSLSSILIFGCGSTKPASNDCCKTETTKIQKISDPYIPFNKLELDLNNLKSLLDNNKVVEVKKLLDKLLEVYKSNSEIVDHIYTEQSTNNK